MAALGAYAVDPDLVMLLAFNSAGVEPPPRVAGLLRLYWEELRKMRL
jgi:preprotein translocase subunit Sec61beta